MKPRDPTVISFESLPSVTDTQTDRQTVVKTRCSIAQRDEKDVKPMLNVENKLYANRRCNLPVARLLSSVETIEWRAVTPS